MPGGYMHLESMGDMDDYLFVKPELTFFKTMYKRHTNFAQEILPVWEQKGNNFDDKKIYNFGDRKKVTIPRNGDLIGDFFLEVKLSNTATHCYGLGNALIENIELTIGGQVIERMSGKCMNIIGELTQNDEKRAVWDKFVGNHADKDCNKLLIPLPFFCSHYEKYIQLIAMSFNEVCINIEFANREKLMLPEDCKIESVNLYGNYIYVDTDERKKIAQTSSEFLIKSYRQLNDYSFTVDQFNHISNQTINIDGNHPTSEIFWIVQNETGQPCQSVCLHNDKYARYTVCTEQKYQRNATESTPSVDGTFNINNNIDYVYKPLKYAHLYNPYSYNTNTPRTGKIYSAPNPKDILTPENNNLLNANNSSMNNLTSTQTITDNGLGLSVNRYLKNGTKYNQYIYSHSFSFDPDNKTQPAGTINLSRVDKCILELQNLKLEPGNYVVNVYHSYYNVLRYASGMAGLAYCG
jgi:hypothetical protein